MRGSGEGRSAAQAGGGVRTAAGGEASAGIGGAGLIDEYEFVVQPRLAGHGPTLFAGLSKYVDLRLVSRLELARGRWRCGMCREGLLSPATFAAGPVGDWRS